MPAKELALVTFHEMGHAINANISKTGQFARKFLPLGKLSTPIALIALFKTKKAPNEEPQGVIDKTTDFIKNNAGKLMFLTFLPRLTEEATASIRGGNWAKKVLDSSLAQKVSTTNKLAYMTYLSAALGVSAGIA
ncbi:MAG: hypothetical protein MZV64_27195 [Ignavibacteriales bacterium]|nr:hypothetical protein [Ignavibacteriales bacterium]